VATGEKPRASQAAGVGSPSRTAGWAIGADGTATRPARAAIDALRDILDIDMAIPVLRKVQGSAWRSACGEISAPTRLAKGEAALIAFRASRLRACKDSL
jgi:hypothetical protein